MSDETAPQMKPKKDLNKCKGSPDGLHHPDPNSVAQADDQAFILDYWCLYCDQSGAAWVDPKSIQWD